LYVVFSAVSFEIVENLNERNKLGKKVTVAFHLWNRYCCFWFVWLLYI